MDELATQSGAAAAGALRRALDALLRRGASASSCSASDVAATLRQALAAGDVTGEDLTLLDKNLPGLKIVARNVVTHSTFTGTVTFN